MADVARLLNQVRIPDVTGLPADEAACAAWKPMVGHTLWAAGAFLERQVFVAHAALLASVAPAEIRNAAEEALAVAAEAAAEQLRPGGDPAVISRRPTIAIRDIGLWAVEHCRLPVQAEDAPDASDWTADEIAFSCDLDRRSLERGLEDYRAGPGRGRYAAHPHVLEVTLDVFVYPAWHRIASVDNEADPPTYRVEPFPGSFCDR
jgi:hypothetical protein